MTPYMAWIPAKNFLLWSTRAFTYSGAFLFVPPQQQYAPTKWGGGAQTRKRLMQFSFRLFQMSSKHCEKVMNGISDIALWS